MIKSASAGHYLCNNMTIKDNQFSSPRIRTACIAILFAGIAPSIGCTDQPGDDQTDDSEDSAIDTAAPVALGDVKSDAQSIAFEVINVGAPRNTSTVQLIRSASRFAAVFGTQPPAGLDFSTSWLAVVQLGGANQRVAFETVEQDANKLFLGVTNGRPDPIDCELPNPQTFEVIKFAKPTGVTQSRYQLNDVSLLCEDDVAVTVAVSANDYLQPPYRDRTTQQVVPSTMQLSAKAKQPDGTEIDITNQVVWAITSIDSFDGSQVATVPGIAISASGAVTLSYFNAAFSPWSSVNVSATFGGVTTSYSLRVLPLLVGLDAVRVAGAGSSTSVIGDGTGWEIGRAHALYNPRSGLYERSSEDGAVDDLDYFVPFEGSATWRMPAANASIVRTAVDTIAITGTSGLIQRDIVFTCLAVGRAPFSVELRGIVLNWGVECIEGF
jgi:hypothetical protein